MAGQHLKLDGLPGLAIRHWKPFVASTVSAVPDQIWRITVHAVQSLEIFAQRQLRASEVRDVAFNVGVSPIQRSHIVRLQRVTKLGNIPGPRQAEYGVNFTRRSETCVLDTEAGDGLRVAGIYGDDGAIIAARHQQRNAALE